MRSSLH